MSDYLSKDVLYHIVEYALGDVVGASSLRSSTKNVKEIIDNHIEDWAEFVCSNTNDTYNCALCPCIYHMATGVFINHQCQYCNNSYCKSHRNQIVSCHRCQNHWCLQCESSLQFYEGMCEDCFRSMCDYYETELFY